MIVATFWLNVACSLALCVAAVLAFRAAWFSRKPKPVWGDKSTAGALLVACVLGVAAFITRVLA
ncbi:membrane protein [Arthrobacter phage KBurrousTX]|uniref:Membrane protein n=1 Tax=Arthrobacter phage KBurrousTX TaxID=2315608 RepID=A0A386K938_9CAUD|nr:membrane protein [Arthrobacter phage KBurrousTX]AYD81557.1 membrane protein [Arthrobacter phage KBurrousTX]